MDPVSISLVAITFATALKDLIETIQVIRDSISEYPQNYRNAKRLAEWVFGTLHGMQGIYKEHEQAFNKSRPLKKAINDLQIEMKLVHEELSHLAPPVSEKKMVRFKMAFYSFWNRKKVEKMLSELRDHVDRCSHDFHLLSSLRTEAHIVEIHDTIVQSTACGSVGVYGRNGIYNPSILHSELGVVTDSQLFPFTPSTSTVITWMPDTIPTRDLSKAYLRREVGRLVNSFRAVLVRWLHDPPTADTEFPLFPLGRGLGQIFVSNTFLHQDAVVIAFHIQSLLQDSQCNSWVNDIYSKANKLAINLGRLEMYEDAIAIWALLVDLRKAIARLYPSPTSSRNLAYALINFAIDFLNIGNQSQAQSTSEEAIEILRQLVMHEPIDQLNKQDAVEMARLVILQERYKPDSARSYQKAFDAGGSLEDALGLTYLRSGTSSNVSHPVTIPPSNWTFIMENQGISDDNWYTYASSLLDIAKADDKPSELHKFTKLAVVILNHLFAKYPLSDRVQHELSRALILLSATMMETLDSQAVSQNLEYIKQNVTILRQQVLIDPQCYVLPLARALWAQRQVLLDLGGSAEADNIYQELISLKDLAAAAPHLDLQIPSQIEGDYYAELARYHYISQHFNLAIYAAQNAISQYSALEFMDPGRSQIDHIHALAWLCKSLCAAHQYDATLSEGLKAITMIDNSNMHDADSDLTEPYGDVLYAMVQALEVSSPAGTLVWVVEINARIRKLARSGNVPSKWKSALFLAKYAALLEKSGMVEDATEAFQEIHDNREIFLWGFERLYGSGSRSYELRSVAPKTAQTVRDQKRSAL